MHVITGLDTGGAEASLYNLLSRTTPKPFEHVVVTLRDGGVYFEKIKELGIRVECINFFNTSSAIKSFLLVHKFIRKFQPQIIQGWMNHGNLIALILSMIQLKGKAILIWNIRQSLADRKTLKFWTQIIIWINKILSKFPARIIYNSEVARLHHEKIGFSSKCSSVIPNGFDLEVFKGSEAEGNAFKSKLSIREGSLVVGHLARFHPMKDHITFVKAGVEVLYKFPQAYFLMAGRDLLEMSSYILKDVPEEKREHFLILDEQKDVRPFLQALDLFCLSSTSESFPNVLGEAMATGIPCVATDCGDSSKIVGSTGIIVPPANVKKLAEAIKEMLSLPVCERSQRGTESRKK